MLNLNASLCSGSLYSDAQPQTMVPMPPAAHLCATLYGCNLERLCLEAEGLGGLHEAIAGRVKTAGFQVVGEAFHYFSANAVTGALVLAESHLCFHTWPEYGVVYLDMFTCRDTPAALKSMEALIHELADDIFLAGETSISHHDRNGGAEELRCESNGSS